MIGPMLGRLAPLLLALTLLWGACVPAPPVSGSSPVVAARSVGPLGATYYVALDGDDANPGTLARPWATLQHAADVLQPGDTVYVRGGVYHQYVRLTRSGEPGRPITYAAYPGETVWLDGQGVDGKVAFDLADGVSHITIVGLNMRHWHDEGGDGSCITSWRDSDHITVRDAEFYDCGSGAIQFYQDSDYITVENVYIHDNTLVGMDCGIGPCGHWVLRRVRAINNGAESGDTAADGIAIERGDDILVEDCEASGNAGDGFDFKSTGTTLRRVIARNNARNNIKLWGERSSLINGLAVDAGLTNLVLSGGGSYTITNSLIASRRTYGYLAVFGEDDYAATTPVRLYNTIFYNDNPAMGGTTVFFSAGVRLQADHNLYYNPYRESDVICADFLGAGTCFSGAQINDGTWSARSGQGEHSAYADPLFRDAPGKDFHLMADSPAVDAGTAAWAPPRDLDGRPRPVGRAPDIGPYEYRPPEIRAFLPVILRGPGASASSALSLVNDFLYQLQNLDLAAIGATAYDLIIMDYSADGTETGEFTAAQIEVLKHSSGGEKIVLAYMSIGEAEDYRFYWQDDWRPGNPPWLDRENPDWPGNYKVHYWDPAWQAIIFAYTDRLLDAGFDGAYLDLIDAYEYYADQERTTAAREMADFVAAIAAHARRRDPDFYIFVQNAPELATRVPGYLDSVDGIGQEDIYYGYEGDDRPTPSEVTAELERYLDVFKGAGKLVLTIDYATTPAHIDDAYTRSRAKGYVPFVTVRDLDRLVIHPGHEPD